MRNEYRIMTIGVLSVLLLLSTTGCFWGRGYRDHGGGGEHRQGGRDDGGRRGGERHDDGDHR